MEMVLDGILSIQAGENPSILKEKLKTHIGNMPNAKSKTTDEAVNMDAEGASI
jgi:chemotaxis protein MotA